MTKAAFLTLLVIFAVSASTASAQRAASSAYPPAVKSGYIKSCNAAANSAANGKVSTAAAQSYCTCTLTYLEAHLTYTEFKGLGKALSTVSAGSAKAKAAFKGATTTCKSKLTAKSKA